MADTPAWVPSVVAVSSMTTLAAMTTTQAASATLASQRSPRAAWIASASSASSSASARASQSDHGSEAQQRDPEPDASLEEDRASVEADPTRDEGAQAEQRCQVEDVRAKRHPDPDRRVPACDGRHRGGDLRPIGGQRCEQSQERLRQTEALAHPLETRYEQHAGDEADSCTEREDPHLHTPFWRRARPVRPGSYS